VLAECVYLWRSRRWTSDYSVKRSTNVYIDNEISVSYKAFLSDLVFSFLKM